MEKIEVDEKQPKSTGNKSGEKNNDNHKSDSFFNRFSTKVTKITGGVHAFLFAFLIILVWAASGPIFDYSDTWQLVINTGTTIITFLMVFIIQHSQNKDTKALQLKLDELISASNASNKLISVENLSEEELDKFNEFYSKVSVDALKGQSNKVHSIDDIEINVDPKSNIKIDTDNVDIHVKKKNLKP